MKKALIVGHTGQDGTYLYQYLDTLNYNIIGISSKTYSTNFASISSTIEITNKKEVADLLLCFQPDEIYFFAAIHQSSTDFNNDDYLLFQESSQINVIALTNFLDSINKYSKKSKLFYAASSHVFGNPSTLIQNERTPLNPNCIYGITKTTGMHLCHFYNSNHNIYASVGVFYNHESPLRSSKFVSKKIVESAVAIKYKKLNKLFLGNLKARIDWGYAPDYVNAAHRILQLDTPDVFVISSGYTHTVGDFVDGVFNYLKLDWKQYVEEDPNLIKKISKNNLQGDHSKLHNATNWTPQVNFSGLIEIMVNSEIEKYNNEQ